MISKRYIDGGYYCQKCGDCCNANAIDNGRAFFLYVADLDYGYVICRIKRMFKFDKRLVKLLIKVYKNQYNRHSKKSCIMRIYRNGNYLCLLQARYGIEYKPKTCQDFTCEKLRKKKKQPIKEALYIKW